MSETFESRGERVFVAIASKTESTERAGRNSRGSRWVTARSVVVVSEPRVLAFARERVRRAAARILAQRHGDCRDAVVRGVGSRRGAAPSGPSARGSDM